MYPSDKRAESQGGSQNIPEDKEVPEKTMLYRFLSRIEDKSFVNVILRILILNKQCKKRRRERASIIVDSTDVQLDINYFRRRIKKEDLEDREFKWDILLQKDIT